MKKYSEDEPRKLTLDEERGLKKRVEFLWKNFREELTENEKIRLRRLLAEIGSDVLRLDDLEDWDKYLVSLEQRFNISKEGKKGIIIRRCSSEDMFRKLTFEEKKELREKAEFFLREYGERLTRSGEYQIRFLLSNIDNIPLEDLDYWRGVFKDLERIFRVSRERKKYSSSEVQSVLFDVDSWTVGEAKKWLKEHGFKYGDVDTTDEYHRFRQFEPGGGKGIRYRTVSFGDSDDLGIKAVMEFRGRKKGSFLNRYGRLRRVGNEVDEDIKISDKVKVNYEKRGNILIGEGIVEDVRTLEFVTHRPLYLARLTKIELQKGRGHCEVGDVLYLDRGEIERINSSYGRLRKRLSNNNKHFIGEEYQGGIIFHINSDGKSGLIVSKEDQSNEAAWKEAISIADNYSSDGYNDWYLPSKEELDLLCRRSYEVRDFVDYYYWSSTEHERNKNYAYVQHFGDGSRGNYLKDGEFELFVLAIRKFTDNETTIEARKIESKKEELSVFDIVQEIVEGKKYDSCLFL